MGRITPLPESLINKIAAGEVIERPASVLKELLENSLDAGAAFIQISVEDGGKRLIRVSDDGAGMAAEDLPLAVAPHATSKLQREEDLFAIATMGFRGEALASIAAVAEVRLTSRLAEQPEGAEIAVVAGQAGPARAVGCPPGTTAEVRNLFVNVPARRKFLRNAATEMGHITEQLARIGLAHPQVGLVLEHNGRCVKRLSATQSRLERIAAFCGPELGESLIPIEQDERGTRIAGWIGRPQDSRATGQWQYFFVNGRYVRDRFVAHAVREAYRGLIEPTRFAPVFLFIEIEPSALDVNVHPTKIEVRWRDSNLIHSQVLSCIREALRRVDLTPALRAEPSVPAQQPAAGRQQEVRQAIADFFKRQQATQRRIDFPTVDRRSAGPGPTPPAREFPAQSDRVASPAAVGAPVPQTPTAESVEIGGPADEGDFQGAPATRAIQLHNTFLVAETPDGIVIVDQHALHERVLYEQLRQRVGEGGLQAQRLLLPEPVRATAAQVAAVQANAALLGRLGIELTAFGPDSIAVQAFPGLLANLDVAEFAQDLLDKLVQTQAPTNSEALLGEVLELMACKAAIKAGDPLQPAEIDALLAQRDQVERGSNCPHGRPTSLSLSMRDLQRQFKRT